MASWFARQATGTRTPQPPGTSGDDLLQAHAHPSSETPRDPDPEEDPVPAGEMDMVVGALSAMVDALLRKIGELLKKEYALLSGVRGDVIFLQDELSSMLAAIHRAESLDDCDQQSRAWINRVRELAYDVDDWVDLHFAISADAGAGGSKSKSNPSSSTGFIRGWIRRGVDKSAAAVPDRRHAVANGLQRLKERALELSERRNRYSLAALPFPTMARPIDARLAALFVDTRSLVGLDVPVKQVSRMVKGGDDDMDLKVISIVGMVGSGKTTLAAAVYQQLQQQNYFQCQCFVTVGAEQGAVDQTLKNLLSQLGNKPRGGEDIGQLISSLRDTLHDKRYLIVVDDLWSTELWVTISHCLPRNKLGSRIIAIARDNELTKDSLAGSRDIVYKIGLLNDADSKKLFYNKFFGTGLDCPRHLKDSCARILKRCGGLPLALVSVASVLAHRQTTDEWRKLAFDLLWSSRIEALQQVLTRCLNDLAPHLRTCMLYLSIFPENDDEVVVVEVERLVRRWVAEGFIDQGGPSSTREETARGYLDKLITRNMVHPLADVNHNGFPTRPRYCKIHPVIRDFIVCKSMEENFVTLVHDAQAAQHNQYVPSYNCTVRRLSVWSSRRGDQPVVPNESTIDLCHARSITVFRHAANATPDLTVTKLLRVLDLQDCRCSVSLEPSKLPLLRYLSLRGTDISELPETIGELRCLETLDVRFTKVAKLPSSIFSLEKLKHLLCGSAKLPSGMAKMKALQTLSCAVVTQADTDIIQEVSRHDELRELELFGGVENRGIFPRDGFQTLKELRIHCGLASVTFEPNVLPRVEVLELMFKGGRVDGSSSVSGIENLQLPSLKYVLIDFSKHDAGAVATVHAVRKATAGYNHVISIKVSGKSHY